MNDIQKKVLEILQQINPDIDNDESIHLVMDGVIDSFDIVNLILELGEEYGLVIAPEEVIPENFKNVFTIAQLISKTLGDRKMP